jgi:hypothetical protein
VLPTLEGGPDIKFSIPPLLNPFYSTFGKLPLGGMFRFRVLTGVRGRERRKAARENPRAPNYQHLANTFLYAAPDLTPIFHPAQARVAG